MIEKLTAEQEAAMPAYVKHWTQVGLDTNTLGLEETGAIIYPLYDKILKKPRPKEIILAASPLSAWREVCRVTNGGRMMEFIWPEIEGQYGATWMSFYDFFITEVGITGLSKEIYDIYKNTCKLGLVYPLDEYCIVSGKPLEIHIVNGRLHNARGPALRYPDIELYCLNGVSLPKDIVMTPAEQLDPKLVVTEKNAERRREIVRKIGVERVALKLGAKILDKSPDGVYELLDINIDSNRTRPYLRMLNPSIGVWHLEGVPPGTTTIKAALAWRNNTEVQPEKLT